MKLRDTKLKALLLLPAAALALTLAGCSSDSNDDADTASDDSTSANVNPETGMQVLPCPTDPPAAGTEPQWTVQGDTGSASFVGATDNNAPLITIDKPFSVSQTQVETLEEGKGAEVSEASQVLVCYMGVNGRTGETFDSAYDRGESTDFPASGVVPGFQQALIGQNVGANVAVVIPPADGYPQGTPDGSIEPGDTIVFALQILDGQTPGQDN